VTSKPPGYGLVHPELTPEVTHLNYRHPSNGAEQSDCRNQQF
jgi:hypothetical protein